jgi:HAD superfamily hydrolase (TIGR01549 family)
MTVFKGVIFDLDGTVVDSKLDFDLMRQEIGIPGNLPILEFLEEQTDPEFIDTAMEIVHRHETKGAHESTLIRDFHDFYHFLKNNNIPLGILTRNSKEIAQLTLEKHNLDFDIVLSRDCCRPKPHPDGLLQIASEWELAPEQLIYIGDFKFDIETAQRAKMHNALILNEKNTNFKLEAEITFEFFNELKKFF